MNKAPWHETVSNILNGSKNTYNVNADINTKNNTLTLDYKTRQTGLTNRNYKGLVDGHVDQFVGELSNIYKKRTGSRLKMSELQRDDRLLHYGRTGNGDHYIAHSRTYQYVK